MILSLVWKCKYMFAIRKLEYPLYCVCVGILHQIDMITSNIFHSHFLICWQKNRSLWPVFWCFACFMLRQQLNATIVPQKIPCFGRTQPIQFSLVSFLKNENDTSFEKSETSFNLILRNRNKKRNKDRNKEKVLERYKNKTTMVPDEVHMVCSAQL